jgi:hypothetical protein
MHSMYCVLNKPCLPSGAVALVNEDSITLQRYNSTHETGERIETSLAEVFPGTCTVCDSRFPTEYCEYEDSYCVKLSNTSVSVVALNSSLLYSSPYMLDTACTPRYLHRLDRKTYGIICRASSYHILRFGENDGPVLEGIVDGTTGASGGILVCSPSGEVYHVELIESVFTIYGTKGLSLEYRFVTECVGSFDFRPTFASNGMFHLSCVTGSGSQVNQLYSAINEDHEMLYLCEDPLFSPPASSAGINTFAVACAETITVYETNNVDERYSMSFGTSIASHFYLNHKMLLVDTGTEQHILAVDTFIGSNGSDGIATLEDTRNCLLLNKTLTPDIFATVCRNGLLYDVRLLDTTRGQELSPITNLTKRPKDIYFDEQELEIPPGSTPDITPSDGPITTPMGTITHTNTTSSALSPYATPTISLAPTPSPDSRTLFPYIIPIGVLVTVAGFLLMVYLLFVWRWKHRNKSRSCDLERRTHHPVQVVDKQGTSALGVTNLGKISHSPSPVDTPAPTQA